MKKVVKKEGYTLDFAQKTYLNMAKSLKKIVDFADMADYFVKFAENLEHFECLHQNPLDSSFRQC